MSEQGELRPAYRTLNEPTRLLGISLAGWATLIVAGAAGYGWLMVSPLPWRANVSLVIIGLGAPAALLILHERTTMSPLRLLLAVVRWRTRGPLVIAPSRERPVRVGGIRLDMPGAPLEPAGEIAELPWTSDNGARGEGASVGDPR